MITSSIGRPERASSYWRQNGTSINQVFFQVEYLKHFHTHTEQQQQRSSLGPINRGWLTISLPWPFRIAQIASIFILVRELAFSPFCGFLSMAVLLRLPSFAGCLLSRTLHVSSSVLGAKFPGPLKEETVSCADSGDVLPVADSKVSRRWICFVQRLPECLW